MPLQNTAFRYNRQGFRDWNVLVIIEIQEEGQEEQVVIPIAKERYGPQSPYTHIEMQDEKKSFPLIL